MVGEKLNGRKRAGGTKPREKGVEDEVEEDKYDKDGGDDDDKESLTRLAVVAVVAGVHG